MSCFEGIKLDRRDWINERYLGIEFVLGNTTLYLHFNKRMNDYLILCLKIYNY